MAILADRGWNSQLSSVTNKQPQYDAIVTLNNRKPVLDKFYKHLQTVFDIQL